MPTTLVEQAHRQATSASPRELAGLLQEVLSRRLTAYIAGVSESKAVTGWANGAVDEIGDREVEQRLRIAYEITQLVLADESPRTVRAWFMGLNPQLGDAPSAEAIRQGRSHAVLSAALAFMAGG